MYTAVREKKGHASFRSRAVVKESSYTDTGTVFEKHASNREDVCIAVNTGGRQKISLYILVPIHVLPAFLSGNNVWHTTYDASLCLVVSGHRASTYPSEMKLFGADTGCTLCRWAAATNGVT